MPLDVLTIRNAKPTDKTQKLFDGGGLHLEISPAGGKWWRYRYRFAGKPQQLSLGTFPDVSLKEAREKRDDARKLVNSGTNPSAHRKAQKLATVNGNADSFESIAMEWHEKQTGSLAAATSRDILARLHNDVLPYLGSRPIAEITAPDLLAVLRRIEARGANESAHRVKGNLSQIFRYGIATGRCTRDPAADLRGALVPTVSKNFASTTEPKELGSILRAIYGYTGTLAVRCALRLSPLVFVRPGELRQAEWKDVNFETAEWRYLVTKTQTNHIVPLATQAIEILKQMRDYSGDGRYVFPCRTDPNKPMSDNAVLSAMRRMGIESDEMSAHGFRAAARTILDEVLGVRVDYIEHQLAHAVRDANGRAYNRTMHLAGRKEMMQQWADYLDRLRLKPVFSGHQ